MLMAVEALDFFYSNLVVVVDAAETSTSLQLFAHCLMILSGRYFEATKKPKSYKVFSFSFNTRFWAGKQTKRMENYGCYFYWKWTTLQLLHEGRRHNALTASRQMPSLMTAVVEENKVTRRPDDDCTRPKRQIFIFYENVNLQKWSEKWRSIAHQQEQQLLIFCLEFFSLVHSFLLPHLKKITKKSVSLCNTKMCL